MSTYDRTTRECPVSELRPELCKAIQDYAQEQQWESLEAEIRLCCETVSTKNPVKWPVSWLTGGLAPTVYMAMLLTVEKLIWVRSANDSPVVLTAADQKVIRVACYTTLFTHESRLEVRGYIEGQGRVRGYIGIGPEPAARNFCDAVRKAISEANPPPPKMWPPPWLRRS